MPSQYITDEELDRIIQKIMQVKPYTKNLIYQLFNSWKWATMLWFAYYGGLRPRCIRQIQIRHIDFINKILYIPAMNSKMRKDENYPIHPVLYKKLMVYMKIRQDYLKKFHDFSYFLFPSSRNIKEPIDKNYLGQKLRKVLKELNIAQISFIDKSGHKKMNKSLYGLRKSFALKVYMATGKIEDVETCLGHTDKLMRSLWRYLEVNRELQRQQIIPKIKFN